MLSTAEVAALNEALLEEYRARSFYHDARARFGAVRPFANLERAEQRHVEAILALFDHYQLAPPAADAARPAMTAQTLAGAYALAADLERGEGPFYDRLLSGTDKTDIRTVFERLRQVSLERHLAVVERGR